MILVDSSVWVDHFRAGDTLLASLLDRGRVLCHPFIIGELALGSLRQRASIIGALHDLPSATVADPDEAEIFIERNRLFGRGIGYVDAHLLASARLTAASLWTRDKRLRIAAQDLGLTAAHDRA